MIRKMWFHGIKSEITISEVLKGEDGLLKGVIHLQSKKIRKVDHVVISLKEVYDRGSGIDNRISEYLLGMQKISDSEVEYRDEKVIIPYSVPYSLKKANIDYWAGNSFVKKLIAKGAKTWFRVRSNYSLHVKIKFKQEQKPLRLHKQVSELLS